MLKERIVDTRFGKVFGMSAGDSDHPLILGLHGWSQRNGWHTWESLIQPLADAGYFVYSIDLPGWGRSQIIGKNQLDSNDGVAVVKDLLSSLNKSEATLLGKSWGGGIAFQSALDHSKKIPCLIVSAPAYRNLSSLRNLSQPVLMAWAEDDPVIPIKYATEYKQVIQKLDLVTFATGGHSAAPNNAEKFVPRAIEFLSRIKFS